MNALQRAGPLVAPKFPPNAVVVDHRRPLRDVLAENRIEIYNGDAADASIFPPRPQGIMHVVPGLEPFPESMSVEQAIACLEPEEGKSFADLWTLVHCAHLLGGKDQKLYAFGSKARLHGVWFFPYIGLNNARRYLSLTRSDFAVDFGTNALMIEQVLVRE